MIEGTQGEVIRELWGTVTDEIDAARERIIQRDLEKALQGVKIGIDNLSESLIQSLMSRTETTKGGTTMKKREMTEIIVSCFEKPITHPKIDEIITDLLTGNNVYLYGRAGTGKTYMAKNIASTMLAIPPEVINCSQWTSPIQIIGGQTIEGYQQGGMIKAWREGKILILDELPKLDPNTAGLLNDALSQSADDLKPCQIFFDGKLKVGTVVQQGEVSVNKETGKEEKPRLQEIVSKVFCSNANKIKYWYFVEKGKLIKIETLKGGSPEKIMEAPEDIKNGEIVYFAPTIKDGKGDMSPKHPDFHVMATGNTDMKDTGGTAYGGNNRQDYSLVDRFSGSYYLIEYDESTEKSLLYNKVFEVSMTLRNYLDSKDALESISLRTMLNFNRIYEQEMLSKIQSNIALNAEDKNFKVKSLRESVLSFLNATNPKSMGENVKKETDILGQLDEKPKLGEFVNEFWNKHGEQDPISGKVIDKTEMQKLVKKWA